MRSQFTLIATIALLVLSATQLTSSTAGSDQASLLILNKLENTLTIVDPVTLRTRGSVPTGEAPHELIASADGRLAFVCNYGPAERPGNTISVIDLAQRKELKRVNLGALLRPHGITESNGKIYFTIEGSRAVARYDPAVDRIDWTMGTGQGGTHMVVVASSSGKVYTANRDSDTVSAIAPLNGTSAWTITQIAVGKAPEGIGLSPDEREVWAAHRGDGGISIIDTATDKVKETLKIGRAPIRVRFTMDGRRVLVSDSQGNEVVVLDASTRKELKRIPVGGVPGGILVEPSGQRAFVASTQANRVSVINLENLSVTHTIESGRGPDGLAWAK
jgi:YVTN family beta-propeller protein